MSGTSMDAIDASLVHIAEDGLEVVLYQQFPIAEDVKGVLRSVNQDSPLGKMAELDVIVGRLFAQAALEIIESSDLSPQDVHAIGSHGQTLLHSPQGAYPYSLQIGDPNIIAYQTGITTVADFRGMDIAAGGEGAPLVTTFHQRYFQNYRDERVILNLGGIANITILPDGKEERITGFDTGPGNVLMDLWIQDQLQQDFDRDGQWAKSGRCDQGLLAVFLNEDFFSVVPPKSTGRDTFNLSWLNDKLGHMTDKIAAHDVQATLLELTAISVSHAVQGYAPGYDQLLVCGGGVLNVAVMQRLGELNPSMQVDSTQMYGLNPVAVEAVAFAWLAQRRMNNQTGNASSVTGATDEVPLGAVYRGTLKHG